MVTKKQDPKVFGAKGEALLKLWEELRFVGYPDTGGVPTAGWGHTGKDVKLGQRYTMETIRMWFANDTRSAIKAVNDLVAVPLSQNQFDALVVFAYNVGVGAFKGSTLLAKLNAGKYSEVPAQLERWNKDDGKVVQGLVNRRKAEIDLWNTV